MAKVNYYDFAANLCWPRWEPITPDRMEVSGPSVTGMTLFASGLHTTLISGPNLGGRTNPNFSGPSAAKTHTVILYRTNF